MSLKRALWAAIFCIVFARPAHSEDVYSFGVVNQRSATLTAQYWNPILGYISAKSGVPLELRIGKTAPDTSAMIGRGEFHFIYSNHQFLPENDRVGYRVFARPIEVAISGQLVVLENSEIHAIRDLEGKDVVFPSKVAFVGYFVPMNALIHAGIKVNALFAGNQEGAMGQLKAGRAAAAGVNSQVMRDFAQRENIGYRVLWSSEPYLNIPLAAHPSVPAAKVKAVRDAFVNMATDPQGVKILEASAALIKQRPPFGFVPATDREYDNQRKLYKISAMRAEKE